MTDAVEHKRYWGLAEILMWIRSRDHERVAAMSDLSENDAMTLALFSYRARLDPRSLPRLRATSSNSDHEAAVLNENGKSSDPDVRSVMDPNRALNDLRRKVHSGRVPMTAIRCDGVSNEQTPVPPVELNDLVFRFIAEPAGLWRSKGCFTAESPIVRCPRSLA
jgi:hypothetical protein